MKKILRTRNRTSQIVVLTLCIALGCLLLLYGDLFLQKLISQSGSTRSHVDTNHKNQQQKVALYVDDHPVQFLNTKDNSNNHIDRQQNKDDRSSMRENSRDNSTQQANILTNNFSDSSIGVYTDAQFIDDTNWKSVRWANFENRATIVEENDNKKLRVLLPKGAHGNLDSGGSAAIAFEPQDEIYQRVTVLFEPGFDFQISGKIVGLGSPQGKYTGGNVPLQGEGFSSRFIWDDRGGQYGRAAIYLYHVDQRENFGDQDGLGFNWKTGVQYTMTQRIKRNTGDKKNGILQVWVSEDGGQHSLVMDRSDMRWGLNGEGAVDTLLISPFHGGSGERYAPDNDSYIQLDDFAVSTKKFSDLP